MPHASSAHHQLIVLVSLSCVSPTPLALPDPSPLDPLLHACPVSVHKSSTCAAGVDGVLDGVLLMYWMYCRDPQASIVLREHPGTTIVTDSVTSNGLTEFITQLGGKHVRCVGPPPGYFWIFSFSFHITLFSFFIYFHVCISLLSHDWTAA